MVPYASGCPFASTGVALTRSFVLSGQRSASQSGPSMEGLLLAVGKVGVRRGKWAQKTEAFAEEGRGRCQWVIGLLTTYLGELTNPIIW